MATRISHIQPKLTLTLAQCANEAYNILDNKPVNVPPPYNNTLSLIFSGRNPSIFKNSVEQYGFITENTTNPGEYIISFRGTDSFMDAWEDLAAEKVGFMSHSGQTINHVRVATGFMGIYNAPVTHGQQDSMQNQLFNFIKEKSPKKLIITGHSLGSALAQLFALDLYISFPSLPFEVQQYNFACPRVGDAGFARMYYQKEKENPMVTPTIRIVNFEDEIPCLPPETLFHYYHGSDYFLIWFREKDTWIKHWLVRHHMYNYWQVLKHVVSNEPQGYSGDVKGLDHELISEIPDNSKTECENWLSDLENKDEELIKNEKRGCLNFLGIFKKKN